MNPEDKELLLSALAEFAYDPVGFVYWAFPWEEPDTVLQDVSGPEEWQMKVLILLRDYLQEGMEVKTAVSKVLRIAVASGHGVGKSALVAMIIWWAISTWPNTRGVVTANTENQLKTKTWVEVAKWYGLFLAKDLFKFSRTAIFSIDPEFENTWRIDMVPWSVHNTEAFAGLHNKGSRILVVFDEASAIPDPIHEVMEGALTDKDTQIIWLMSGNPTLPQGRFREAFPGGRFEHRWKTLRVDSRTVSFTNKEQIAEWEADFGEDSDFFRIRVTGEFPRVDGTSFISHAMAMEAAERPLPDREHAPLVIGVDVARFGDDNSVIVFRRGSDARSIPPIVLPNVDLMTLAGRVCLEAKRHSASAVFVDVGGMGAGVVDRCRQLGLDVIEVDFGSKPTFSNTTNPNIRYLNKRTEIWGEMREWINTRGCIPAKVQHLEESVASQISSVSYSLNDKDYLFLESKRSMRRARKPSPDYPDALATTFAEPIISPDELETAMTFQSETIGSDWNPYERNV